MAHFLWLNWSGGGNLPPSLGIARALTARGHSVTFAGRPEMVEHVEAAGLSAIELTQSYAQVDRYPQGNPLTRAACYLTSPAVAAQVRDVVESESPDVAIIDAMFPAALSQSQHFPCPTAVACHTFVFRQLEQWRQQLARLTAMREKAGFGPLPDLDALWLAQDRILVTAQAELDGPRVNGWDKLRHVGPVLDNEKRAAPAALPWADDDPTPLVLVGFTTGIEQRSVDKIQRTLDALAPLPVHVVATTGAIVDPSELNAPANALVLSYADHGPILRRAALTITHGGHGTAMRSLKHGVPMILMPGLAHDQPVIAAAVEQWGAGRALPGEASVDAIRTAAQDILGASAYRQNAERIGVPLRKTDGAAAAATELESVIGLSAMPAIRSAIDEVKGRTQCYAQ